jgi:hypothetical protein
MSHCPNCQRHTNDPARPCVGCGARPALVAIRADGTRQVTGIAPPTRTWTATELALLVVLALLLFSLSVGVL